MDSPSLQLFYQAIQKSCLPGVWSKGVTLARDGLVQIDSQRPTEIILRVKAPGKSVSPKVSLWPEDEDSHCDCGERVEPCAHIAAAVSALKNGLQPDPALSVPIRYRFVRSGNALTFERWLGETRFNESLVAYLGGVQSGRLSGPLIAATQEDLTIDRVLGEERDGPMSRALLIRLLPALRSIAGLELDRDPIEVGTPIKGIHAELREDGAGFRLVGIEDATVSEVFAGGALRCGKVLRLLEDPGLTPTERQWLASPGKWFSKIELPDLVTRIIPALETKIVVKTIRGALPEATHELPRIVLNTEKTGTHGLSVYPSIMYSSPYSVRDPETERQLFRKLRDELNLTPGQRTEFRGMAAIDFVQRAREWEIAGEAAQEFALESELTADFQAGESGLQIGFRSKSGKQADPRQLLRAWREDQSHVPLLGGGYAPLPWDWLSKFGERILRLIEAKDKNDGKVPPYMRPELVDLSDEIGGQVADPLRAFKSLIDNFEKIPEAKLPDDLQADLRHYQRQGINWLCFLRDSGMGALLADDMGLGKTLQALCAIQGRTLVVTPTSVIHGWAEQIKKFRPGLKLSLYYGPNRKLDPEADVTLTSYGLLRLDREAFLEQTWDTAILDEAQIIKNPGSQVAQAAHQLKAKFRMTLSGTPVENSMEDLWSQFQFLNPGLFGGLRDFQEHVSGPVSRGDAQATRNLRTRIRPFVLRRLKRDVAPELPPRTEVVLHCELSPTEKELYEAILASSRKEVLEQLEEGGSVFGALELLLRLRQACCHPSLVPGQIAETSSKLELLAQTLESSIAQGHRALVFSQWTSFLDLIGPRLDKMGLNYLRLDGSTTDRQKVVREFQDPNGPPVMLISLKAGGVGLTLTAADHVFLMDSWWNPAVEDQAADRVHRIGQEDPVLICRLIVKETLEERILALQKQKLELASAVLEGGAKAASLTREDILALLGGFPAAGLERKSPKAQRNSRKA